MNKSKIAIFDFESQHDVDYIIGVDEAGRGPLAGPLYVSAFSFFEHKKEILKWIENLDNSKIISEKHREKLYKQIGR